MSSQPSRGANPLVVVLLIVAVIIAVVAAVYSARTAFKGPDPSIFPSEGGFPEGSGWIMTEEGTTVPLSEYEGEAESESAEGAETPAETAPTQGAEMPAESPPAETAGQFMIIRRMLLDKLGTDGYRTRVVATTDPERGTLRNIAANDGLPSLDVPDGVGGRFSVLSAVGLFSAAMCGIDIDSLLAGARDMDTRVSSEDFYRNPAAINAAIHHEFYNRGKRISVMMPYSYALKDLADWYRQLWAESLGKANDLTGNQVNIGPTPVKALGTTDQHSQVQLYREGPNDKLFTFLQVNNFETDLRIGPAPDTAPELAFLAGADLSRLLNSEKKATEYALLQSRRPCLTVIFDRVNAYAVGQFIYLFEVTTSLAGALFDINPYDQPAVELGKEATFALMDRPGYENLSAQIQPLTEIDSDFLV